MKTRLDNDIIDFMGACTLYAENDTKLLWQIELGAICDENQTEQEGDRLYRCNLYWNQYWIDETYLIVCGLWWKP